MAKRARGVVDRGDLVRPRLVGPGRFGDLQADGIDDPAEFTCDYEGRISTVFTDNGTEVGLADAGVTTAEQCLVAAKTRPVGTEEPVGAGTRVEVGTRLCVLTARGAVALPEVTALGPERPFGGVVDLRATLWKKG